MTAARPAGPARGHGCARRVGPPDDRWTAAAPGPQARRPARPARAPARAVLPLHRPGPADRQGGRQRPDDPDRPVGGSVRAFFVGRPLASRGRARRAAGEEEGPRDLQLGRDQLVGLRDRGDPAGPDPRRRRRAGLRARGQHRHQRSCWSSWRSATARSASPTRPAAARTRSRAGTSGARSRSSRRRPCSSTTC